MRPGNFFVSWGLDLRSILIGMIVLPVAYALIKTTRRHLQSWSKYWLEGILHHAAQFFLSKGAYKFTLRRYCRLKLEDEKNRYLYVPSILDIKLDIDQAFITLTMEASTGRQETYNHADLVRVGNRGRIIGDPGSGKTSLVKKLMRDACLTALKYEKSAQFPVSVELKTLTPPSKSSKVALGLWLFNKIKSDVARTNAYQISECFETYLQNAGVLILLDGLDEVASDAFPHMRLAILDLSDRLASIGKNNRIFVTMRSQFHQQIRNSFRDSFGPVLSIRQFTPTDIYEFISRWEFPDRSREHISRIYQELTDRPSLREMCGNPLVLAMYVAEDQAHPRAVVPNSRTEFYKKVTDELMILRRLIQTGETPGWARLKEQRERILGRIAYHHLVQTLEPANSLDWNYAISTIGLELNIASRDAEPVFNGIAQHTGLISEERPKETFRFIHLTFCEYLAAVEAVHGMSDGWGMLIAAHKLGAAGNRAMTGRLTEVIPFVCGLVPRNIRTKTLSKVEALGDDYLLARCLLETKAYEHSCWTLLAPRMRHQLLKVSESEWNHDWLQKLYLFSVLIRDAEECRSHDPAIPHVLDMDEFLLSLVRKQKDSMTKLLVAYSRQDAVAVFRLSEVLQLSLLETFPEIIISNCDQKPFLEIVLSIAFTTTSTDRIFHWANILSEAALRSRVVAVELDQREIPQEWIKSYKTFHARAQGWSSYLSQEKSAYGHILDIATTKGFSISDMPKLELVELLFHAPSPKNFKFQTMATTPAGLLLIAGLFLAAISFSTLSDWLHTAVLSLSLGSTDAVISTIFAIIFTSLILVTRGNIFSIVVPLVLLAIVPPSFRWIEESFPLVSALFGSNKFLIFFKTGAAILFAMTICFLLVRSFLVKYGLNRLINLTLMSGPLSPSHGNITRILNTIIFDSKLKAQMFHLKRLQSALNSMVDARRKFQSE